MQARTRRWSWLALGTLVAALVLAVLFAGGAKHYPVNPPITQVALGAGYRFDHRQKHLLDSDKSTVAILAFSGGGTRAAAFSYGVLEALRRIEVSAPNGRTIRLLDEVDVITGVSGGSFTALAFGLYGDKLFDVYETSFLKRDVQGELIKRMLSPRNWAALWSSDWTRSEVAAQLYDEILFHGATYADLDRGVGPLIVASATDITTGGRLEFQQSAFDYLCSDLNAVPLSRAAAASSAVPLALAAVTFNNYGGSCKFVTPQWIQAFSDVETAPRPAARAVKEIRDLEFYQSGAKKPYVHLVDGALSDNLGMRGVLETLEELEALKLAGKPTPLDHVKRIVIFVVDSKSAPKTDWDLTPTAPSDLAIVLKSAGVPIDHFSYEAIELLRDTKQRWQNMRRIRESAAFAANKDPALSQLVNTPDVELYAINVSFSALADKAELDYLNNLPTSFVLPPEAVDRLRAAAGKIILSSPEFQRLMKDSHLEFVTTPPSDEGRSMPQMR
jgi:NTE family protein